MSYSRLPVTCAAMYHSFEPEHLPSRIWTSVQVLFLSVDTSCMPLTHNAAASSANNVTHWPEGLCDQRVNETE